MSSSATTKSSSSIPSITSSSLNNPCKTPKAARRGSCTSGGKSTSRSSERMITIKCQRMTADKTCEEIDVEVSERRISELIKIRFCLNFKCKCEGVVIHAT